YEGHPNGWAVGKCGIRADRQASPNGWAPAPPQCTNHAEMTFVRRATSGSAHMTLTGDQLEGQRERFRLGAVKRRTQDHPSSSSPGVTLSAYLTWPARVRNILIDSVSSDHTLNGAATTSRARGGTPIS